MVEASLTGVSRRLEQTDWGSLDRTVEAKPGIQYTNILCRIRVRLGHRRKPPNLTNYVLHGMHFFAVQDRDSGHIGHGRIVQGMCRPRGALTRNIRDFLAWGHFGRGTLYHVIRLTAEVGRQVKGKA
jgi:hypothetical protein